MNPAPLEIQAKMLSQIKEAVTKHREETNSTKPLYLVMNTRDFKRMRNVKGMKCRVHYYPFVPEGAFYLSENKPNPDDYKPKALPTYDLEIDEDQTDFRINLVPEDELIDPAFKWVEIKKEHGEG